MKRFDYNLQFIRQFSSILLTNHSWYAGRPPLQQAELHLDALRPEEQQAELRQHPQVGAKPRDIRI